MKVHDFAKRLGLPDSSIRYYDRMGLIQSGRQKENNYRHFTEQDALAIYHARMLRSFDMSVQEAEEKLEMKLVPVEMSGQDFIDAVLDERYDMERENDGFVYVRGYPEEEAGICKE